MDKLSIHNEMACFDRKDRGFYRGLTDEEKKKFSNYLMIRWGSAVTGSRDMQQFYVIATNERLNRHFFAVNRHPELQWFMATSVSPGMGTQRHQWIAPKKKTRRGSDVRDRIAAYFPAMKADDVDAMAAINTAADLRDYDQQHGSDR